MGELEVSASRRLARRHAMKSASGGRVSALVWGLRDVFIVPADVL